MSLFLISSFGGSVPDPAHDNQIVLYSATEKDGAKVEVSGQDSTCQKLSNKEDGLLACTFTGENPSLTGKFYDIANVQNQASAKAPSVVKLSKDGKAVEKADFNMNKNGGSCVINGKLFYAPANSHVSYSKSTGVVVSVPSGGKIENEYNVRGAVRESDFNSLPAGERSPYLPSQTPDVVYEGTNIKLSSGDVLEKGSVHLLYTGTSGFASFNVVKGESATINGVEIKPISNNVELRFGATKIGDGRFFGETGNFVRFEKDKLKIQGTGFDVKFSPENFYGIKNTASQFNSFSFNNAKNKRYYSLGDGNEGNEDIIKIQKLVGVEPTGVYNKETKDAVSKWQEKNGLTKDGNFGSGSLIEAKNLDTSSFTQISANGVVLVSNKDGKVDISSKGNSIIVTGQTNFKTNDIGQISKIASKGVTSQPNAPTKINTDSKSSSFSLQNSKNGHYFELNDKGEDVKEIQKLVGAKETGTYDQATKNAVSKWQEKNGLTKDGKFGMNSFKVAKEDSNFLIDKVSELTYNADKTTSSANKAVSSGPSLLNRAEGYVVGKAAKVVDKVLSVAGAKKNTPFSAEFLGNYLSGGRNVDFEAPKDWQEWIVDQIKTGKAKQVSPGLYQLISYEPSAPQDIKTSLGGFAVTVAPNSDGTKNYKISDDYDFHSSSWIKQMGIRHCLPSEVQGQKIAEKVATVFGDKEYDHSSGKFKEKAIYSKDFSEKSIGTAVCFSEQWLEQNGKPFKVTSNFNS